MILKKWRVVVGQGFTEFPFEQEQAAIAYAAQVGGTKTYVEEDITAQLAEEDLRIKNEKIDILWRKATEYESSFISGSAPAGFAIRALQGDTKAIAVQQWLITLWADYYNRKQAILSGAEVSDDFSNNGPIPYTVEQVLFA